jgi:hypothetical protein
MMPALASAMKVRARALGLTRWPLAHRALSQQFELAASWPEILGMSDDAFKAAGGSLHPRQLGAEGIYVTETGMRCDGVRQRFSTIGAPLGANDNVDRYVNGRAARPPA